MSSAEGNQPSGRREITKAQNRQTILTAARQVFAQLGFGPATVRDIIRATPLASGTFYNYFKSKEEVYQAIRDEMALAIRPHLAEGRATAATAEDFISRSFGIFFEFVRLNRAELHTSQPAADQWRLARDAPEMTAGFEELRSDLDAAIGKGLFPLVDTEYLAAAFFGVAFEVADRLLRRENGDAAAAAQFATALLLGGINSLPQRS